MSRELEPLRKHIGESFLQREGREIPPYTIIGGILYDSGTKLAVVAANKEGSVVCGHTSEFDPTAINQTKAPGRIVNLQNYKEVVVLQVDLPSISIDSYSSIRREEPSLFARLSCINAQTREVEEYDLEEEQLLRLMTGEKGGIAVFYGGGLPEENALVIEEEGSFGTNALIVFLHPKETDWLKSVDGVAEFLHSLNEQFLNSVALASGVKEAIRALDKEIELGKKIKDSARIEIFKACLIAHARLALLTGEKKHQDFTSKHLAPVDSFRKRRILPQLQDPPQVWQLSQSVDGAVNALIIDHTAQTEAQIAFEEKRGGVSFSTDRSLQLYDFYHDQMGEQFGQLAPAHIRQAMINYLIDIVGLAGETTIISELRDTEIMLRDILGKDFGSKDSIYFNYHSSDGLDLSEEALNPKRFEAVDGKFHHHVSVIINNYLLPAIVNKKSRLYKEQDSLQGEIKEEKGGQ